MSFQSECCPVRVKVKTLGMIAVLCTFIVPLAAQDQPVPKVELFGGYTYFYPGAVVTGQLPGALYPISSRLESNPRGTGASITYDFNRWIGLTLDASTDWGSDEVTLAKRIDDAAFANLSFGPKITFRSHRFSPFLEVLVGDQRLVPDAFHDVDKLGFMTGGGLDINLSRHIALRLIRADFMYSNYSYGPPSVPGTNLRGVRLQTGLNFMIGGGTPELSPSAACSALPSEVFAGEPVTATATGSNFRPKRSVKYNWSGTPAKVAWSDASTQIDTTGLAPGAYQANANLSDGTTHGVASCVAMFRVRSPRPPVIACSTDPATIMMGENATVHSTASSPDNRKLTYSYTASAGSIAGDYATASIRSRGAQPGQITITCSVSDDRSPALVSSSTTIVNVTAPPPPLPVAAPPPEIKQLEAKLALHSIYFQTGRPTALHPEGGLLDSQAQILELMADDLKSYLKYRPDAHLVLGAHADLRGSEEFNKALRQRRLERTRTYLIKHGIPEDHIEMRSYGKEDQLSADQVKEQIANNPHLSSQERQQMLSNLPVMVLANNRRVDVTLNTIGAESTRRYPFNAKDYLALINTKGAENKPVVNKKQRVNGAQRNKSYERVY
jgi:outer membrane protein OmpA-like peptidoglycan-associated protein